jgi:hypothetical protein
MGIRNEDGQIATIAISHQDRELIRQQASRAGIPVSEYVHRLLQQPTGRYLVEVKDEPGNRFYEHEKARALVNSWFTW